MIRRSIYTSEIREGNALVRIPHEGYVEGSLGALNGNLKRVEFDGSPPLKGSKYRLFYLYLTESAFFYAKKGGTAEFSPSSLAGRRVLFL